MLRESPLDISGHIAVICITTMFHQRFQTLTSPAYAPRSVLICVFPIFGRVIAALITLVIVKPSDRAEVITLCLYSFVPTEKIFFDENVVLDQIHEPSVCAICLFV
jgi:hypothetical protein